MTAERDLTLDRLVTEAAERTPDAPGVRLKNEVLSYGELERAAQRVQRFLQAHGVERGDRVGLYQPKSLRSVAALIGILRAGAAYVPIDPLAPAERAHFILEHCRVRHLFASGRALRQIAALEGRFLDRLYATDDTEITTGIAEATSTWGQAEAEAESRPPEPTQARPDHLAYVLYTSGSTGRPKGVAISHAQALSFVRPAADVFQIQPSDVFASHAPFNFDISVIDLYCAFCRGAEMVIIPETWLPFPAKIGSLLETSGVTVWNSVPSALIQLINHGALQGRDLSRMRLIVFAGEPFATRHLRRLMGLIPSARYLNVYGQTEANSSTYHEVTRLPDDDVPSVPIGRPFPGYEIILVGDDGEPVTKPGVDGEMHVAGGAVATGYWEDPDRTALAFVQHPLKRAPEVVYRTGDRACYNEDGELVFRGRVDFAVKCRGYRVELSEVEAAAQRVGAVRDAAAVPVPDEEFGNLLVLFYTGEPQAESEVRSTLRGILPRYMLPEAVVPVDALPRTATGKLDRTTLKRRASTVIKKSEG